jgi:hypothetical protein
VKVDDELKLAREDYAAEDRVADNLLKTAQFHLTLATLLGGASLAIARATRLVPRVDVFVIAFVFALLWISLLHAALKIKAALESRTTGVVPPLATFFEWRKNRTAEILRSGGFTEAEADDLAAAESLEAMKSAYVGAAKLNHRVNAERQAILTEGMGDLIVTALYLALLGGVYLAHFAWETAANGGQQQHTQAVVARPENAPAASRPAAHD